MPSSFWLSLLSVFQQSSFSRQPQNFTICLKEPDAWASRFFEQRDLPVRTLPGIVPYADHFPFVAAGVPGITMWRANCASGRFFHHRPDDDLTRVSTGLMARLLDALAALVAELASAPELPFPRSIPASQAEEVARFWGDLFGGWEEPTAVAPAAARG